MTLLQARKTVLKSIASELNDSYLSLYDRLNQGLLLSRDAHALKLRIDELENLMGYVRHEAEAIGRESLKAAAREVESLWQGEKHAR